ncbi:SDR family oxidoreductase [Xenorhabdus bovienii]|uniref:SDR family NAD(P)-dependent oxidoreductase n=2 Tax=Xenorhabdus bovienii TaxID=40576 RepID=UPI00237C80A7|nr:SDR family oxidoreductase [Xenorhabdus bovienii]MDE1488809.1 SDR family oxidoreductase [Xenorhabdus bovienii]MDE9479684.1 SDR family oxidoreductase [Xenorhabdus bovienii]MDE9532603.1 SDR family oxidoreductase [Xenorhabdus bovienii]
MNNKKSALVVGGSTGVGRGVAEQLYELGYSVHIISRSEPKSDSYNFNWHQCDLRDIEGSQNILKEVCNNTFSFACFSAAFYGPKRCNFLEINWKLWREQSAIMIDGLWLTLSSILPYLIKNNGIFLGISSEVAFNFGPNRAGYTACKSAALGLLGSISAETPVQNTLITQALPEGMVDSPGIRARRDKNFDYSLYMQPDDFKHFIKELVTKRNPKLHGNTVMVKKNGDWSLVNSGLFPPSQSKRQGASIL